MPIPLLAPLVFALTGLVLGSSGCSGAPDEPQVPKDPPQLLPPIPTSYVAACQPGQTPSAYVEPYTCTGVPGHKGKDLPLGNFRLAPEMSGKSVFALRLIQPVGDTPQFIVGPDRKSIELVVPKGLLEYLDFGKHYANFKVEETGFDFNIPFRLLPPEEPLLSDACLPQIIPLCITTVEN